MKTNKLLTLSAALLLTLTVAACGNNQKPSTPASEAPSSEPVSEPASEAPSTPASEETPVEDTALEDAAGTLWEILRKIDGTNVTASFNVNKVVAVISNDERVTIEVNWEFTVTEGKADYISLGDKDASLKTVTVNFGPLNDVDTVATLKPTLTYKGETKTLTQILGESAKDVITVTVPKFQASTHEDWVAAKSDATKAITLVARVVDIIDPTSSSSSKGSMYVVTSEGYGYYVYCPTAPADGVYAKVGDTVLVNGTRSDYSGQEEFAKGATYSIIDNNSTIALNATDATEAFAAATSNKTSGELGNTYQNALVELKGCVPTRVDGSYYYFKVGNGETEYNVYDNYYFLSEAERTAFKTAFNKCLAEGKKFDLKGISTVFSNAYQIYLTAAVSAEERFIEREGMSDAEKEANVRVVLAGAIKDSYDTDTEITIDLPSYVQEISYAVTEGDTVTADGAKLVIKCKDADVANKVTATVKLSDTVSFDVELVINTENNTILKYVTAKLDYNTFVAASTSTTAKATNKKSITDQVELTLTHSAIGDASANKEFNIGKSGGFLALAAPEGYKIGTVEIEYYKYINLTAHASADNTGATIDGVAEDPANSSGKLMKYVVDGDNVYFENASSYDNSLYYVIVTLTKSAGEGEDDPVVEKKGLNISTITALGELAADGTYLAADSEFEYLGAKWNAGVNVGRPTATNAPTYNALGLVQLRGNKDGSVTALTSKEAISGVTKITITWYATYNSEATKYFPTVKAGDSADALVAVAADQTEALTGEATGLTDGTSKNYSVYKYVNTYTLDGSAKFFEISAGASATYFDTIEFE